MARSFTHTFLTGKNYNVKFVLRLTLPQIEAVFAVCTTGFLAYRIPYTGTVFIFCKSVMSRIVEGNKRVPTGKEVQK